MTPRKVEGEGAMEERRNGTCMRPRRCSKPLTTPSKKIVVEPGEVERHVQN
jgi:hypothetical protein